MLLRGNIRKIVCIVALVMISATFFSFFTGGNAHAAEKVSFKPANCGSGSLENGSVIGYGSTPAHVKVVIWDACDGGYYASAYSTPDSRGWKFAGNLSYGAYTEGVFGDTWHETSSVNCTATACDSPELYNVDPNAVMHGFYETYNGSFSYCNPAYRCALPTELQADA